MLKDIVLIIDQQEELLPRRIIIVTEGCVGKKSGTMRSRHLNVQPSGEVHLIRTVNRNICLSAEKYFAEGFRKPYA